MSEIKATHRLKINPNDLYYDVGNERDCYGRVCAKLVSRDKTLSYWATVQADDLEPIPAPPEPVQYDYESWFALVKEHGGNVFVRNKDDTSTARAPYFSTHRLWGEAWETAMTALEYTTDFGRTWRKCVRQV